MESIAVVSPVLGIEIVFAVGCTEIVVPAVKVTIVEKETALPITLVEKLRVGGCPLNERPKPNGEEPGKVVDAEKLISYTPVSKTVRVSEPLKDIFDNSNVSLNCILLPGDTVCAFVFPNTAVVTGIGVPAGPVAPVAPVAPAGP
ncbi:DUF3982 domain-containing protein [Bacillus pacificus]|uniref:DUF3982 domain-containing protein n=1 Tax=Bacillus pacificus TaxID=2026187 RepID=A0ABX6ID08_9BACI|nr:DUF3982 domain-containing protein [Bacillus pacificus]